MDLSQDDWDEVNDPRDPLSGFDRVLARGLHRRSVLAGLVSLGSGAAVMGPAFAAPQEVFDFDPVPIGTGPGVNVPPGYRWQTLIRWGDPLFGDAPVFDPVRGVPEAGADRVFGENTDGMEAFTLGNTQVIAVNHEFANFKINLPHTPDGRPQGPGDVRRLQDMQGVSVIEIARSATGWQVVLNSPLTRRITQRTPMRLAGPAAGHELLQTSDDPGGTRALGTFANCGSGRTPWGTYLTCEENFNGYFGSTDADMALPPDYARYGIGRKSWRYDYHLHDPRFDVARNPGEPRRMGYVVEIDPGDPSSMPVKRTALGRFKHENAELVQARDGRVVVYMGDDERGEYLYRYVSHGVYRPGQGGGALLDQGQLYAARFEADGTGRWLALTPEATGMSAARIAILTRVAASRLGATTMDRPEWVAVHPTRAECYCALTNNKDRGEAGMPVNGPNPRADNRFGQIVRWWPEGGDHGAARFTWDLYVMAGNPAVFDDARAGSGNINAGNLFNSPDGMQFDSRGRLWIQTDGRDSNAGRYAGMGNNQMLVGDPATGRIERFMTGPKGCEVTGLCWSADRSAMFVGIQHPDAPFPDGPGSLPRSSIIAVTRDDGAPFG